MYACAESTSPQLNSNGRNKCLRFKVMSRVLKTDILKKFPEVVSRETLSPEEKIMRERLASGIPIYIDEDYYTTFDTYEVVDEKNIGHYATWRDWQTYTLRQNEKGEKCYIVTGGRYD